jgi:hypothetical protein
MNRRNFLTALIGTPALAAFIAACGDDTAAPGDTVPGDTTATSDPTATSTLAYATGSDDAVVRIGYEGGFVAASTVFMNTPTLLISGDGRAIQPGAYPAVYPGPLLPALRERSIDEEGIQTVLRTAEVAGLLGPIPDYSSKADSMVADAANTVVTITVNGETYRHSAYALDIPMPVGFEDTPARTNLAEFVAAVGDLEGLVGTEHLGADDVLTATAYRFRAEAVDPTQWTDPAPTIVPWPSSIGIRLADAGECATADAATVGTVFTDANQLTFFTDAASAAELVYSVAATQVLPGDPPC